MKLMKHVKEKFFFAFMMLLVALPASANTSVEQIGQQIAEQITKFGIVIGAMGLAGIGVVVLATAFKMAFSFVKSLR